MKIESARLLLDRYILACEVRDVDGIVDCFDPTAVVSDPLCESIAGKQAIAAYFRGLYEGLASLRLSVGDLYCKGDEVACHWIGYAVRTDQQEFKYQGIDVFKLTAEPAILRLTAYWDPATFPGLV